MNRTMNISLAVGAICFALVIPNSIQAQGQPGSNGGVPVSPGRIPPDYPVPYGTTTVAAITEVLDRIHGYLDAHTPARLVNKQTGAEITDFSKPDPNAVVERGHFPIIAYEWGVTYSGMLLAYENTGDPRFKEYVAKRMQFIVDRTPYFRALDESGVRGTNNPFRSVL